MSVPYFRGVYPDGPPSPENAFTEDSKRTLAAIIVWLTGKTTGANILILQEADPGQYNTIYGADFQAALTSLGHSFQLTGNRDRFNGYDPVNYDMMCGPGSTELDITETYQGTTDSGQKYDYILNNGGRVLAWIRDPGEGPLMWETYGISISGTAKSDHSSADPYYGPPAWSDQHPFQTTELLPPGVGGSWGSEYWALPGRSDGATARFLELQNPPSAGGSVTGAACALHPGEAVIAFWKNS